MSKKLDLKDFSKFVEGGKATRFQPGNKVAVGNKGGGRPKMSPEQKQLTISTRRELSDVMVKYATLNAEEVEALLNDPKLPLLDKGILKNLQRAQDNSDGLDWMLDHIMGKEAEKIQINSSKKLDLSKYSPEELEQLRALAIKGQK